MARSLYRDTIMLRGPAGLIPLAGAQVWFYEPDGGGTLTPIAYPLYPNGVSTDPLPNPFVTGALGELEVWADDPHRIRIVTVKPGYGSADETIDLAIDPNANLLTEEDAALLYLTKEEAALTYLPLTGGTVTGTLTVTGRITSNQDFSATGAAAGYVLEDRNLGQPASWTMYATDNTLRWYAGGDRMSLTNAGALSVVGAATVGGDVSAPGLFASGGGYWFGTRMGAAANRLEFLYGAAGAATTPLAYLFSDGSLYTGITPKLVGVSPDASNTLEWRANGFYATGGGGITQADADLRYVNTAGDTMTGGLTVPYLFVTRPAGGLLQLDGPAGTFRDVVFTTAAGSRWLLGANPTAEAGSHSGSDFQLTRYDDAGTPSPPALLVNRATGAAAFGGNVTVTPPGYLRAGAVRLTDPQPGGQNTYEWYYVTGADTLGFRFGSDAGGYTDTGIAFTYGGGVNAKTMHATVQAHVAGKPILPSPDAGNALVWNANGFFVAPSGGGITQADADLRYVNTAGDTMTGNLSLPVLAASLFIVTPELYLDSDAQSNLLWRRNGGLRWYAGITGAEAGSNSGSDWSLNRIDDGGAFLGTPLAINRATGAATFGGAVAAPAVTLTPTAGAPALVANTGSGGQLVVEQGAADAVTARIRTAGLLELSPGGGFVVPAGDATRYLGHPALRWANFYTVAAEVAGKPVAVSPDAGNALEWRANGFYVTPKITVAASAPGSPATGDLWVW